MHILLGQIDKSGWPVLGPMVHNGAMMKPLTLRDKAEYLNKEASVYQVFEIGI